jgi:SAM-dependent methyltransferase
MTDDFLFISSPVSVLRGDAARVELERTNDAAYLTEGKGVLSVPLDRWNQAQAYERETWLTHAINSTDDRNLEHADMFGGYKALPEKLGRVIELGCGPFTNWRIIMRDHTADDVTLLDPLAEAYRENHPHCAYRDGGDMDNRWHWYPVNLVASAIEDFETDSKFDTVILINVLTHVLDVEKVFSWIGAHLKKGGHLVFAEPVRDIDPMRLYDVGHPISFNQSVIDDFLAGFKPKFRNDNYFIGTKK